MTETNYTGIMYMEHIMKPKHYIYIGLTCLLSVSVFAQTKNAYNMNDSGGGLFNTSRLSVNQSIGFDMGTSTGSGLQSQGMYSTMLSYRFSRPLTLKANFGLPIYSTFSPYQNLNQQNITSTEYFKNMPVEASLLWKPSANLGFQITMSRNNYGYFSGYPWYSRSMFDNFTVSSNEPD
jgi:hypothetical protein